MLLHRCLEFSVNSGIYYKFSSDGILYFYKLSSNVDEFEVSKAYYGFFPKTCHNPTIPSFPSLPGHSCNHQTPAVEHRFPGSCRSGQMLFLLVHQCRIFGLKEVLNNQCFTKVGTLSLSDCSNKGASYCISANNLLTT